MIISHKYRFIFIKTKKTAGTSIETYLSPFCGEDDTLTPIGLPTQGHTPRNWQGWWNPLDEVIHGGWSLRAVMGELRRRRRYFSHIEAWRARARTPRRIWDSYFKFCVERNPWDKAISLYHFLNAQSTVKRTIDQYLANGDFAANYPIYLERGSRSELIVDRVLQYDRLNEELADVFGRLGVPFPGTLSVREKANFRPDRRHYREVLTDTQSEKIAEICAPEIALFGYRF